MGGLMSYIFRLLFNAEHPIAMNWVVCIAGVLAFLTLTFYFRKS